MWEDWSVLQTSFSIRWNDESVSAFNSGKGLYANLYCLFCKNRTNIRTVTEIQGVVINYDREGGWKHFRKFSEKFQTPTCPGDKNSTPSRFQRIISDPNISLKRKNIHILVSNACHSIWPSVIRPRSFSVFVAYTSFKDIQKNSVSSKDN